MRRLDIMNEEEFDRECDKALVRVAKLYKELQNAVAVAKVLVKKNDPVGALLLGIIVGTTHGLYSTYFAHTVVHNFFATMKKLDDGVSEEEILRELEKARKEAMLRDFMTYGSY